jgi:hypothetical protein
MKKTRLTLLLVSLTAAAWSLPGLAQAQPKSCHQTMKVSSAFDGSGQVSSAFDGSGQVSSAFDGGSAFDGS